MTSRPSPRRDVLKSLAAIGTTICTMPQSVRLSFTLAGSWPSSRCSVKNARCVFLAT